MDGPEGCGSEGGCLVGCACRVGRGLLCWGPVGLDDAAGVQGRDVEGRLGLGVQEGVCGALCGWGLQHGQHDSMGSMSAHMLLATTSLLLAEGVCEQPATARPLQERLQEKLC